MTNKPIKRFIGLAIVSGAIAVRALAVSPQECINAWYAAYAAALAQRTACGAECPAYPDPGRDDCLHYCDVNYAEALADADYEVNQCLLYAE